MEYRTIPTTLGRAKLEQAALLGVPLQLTLVEFGDGDGAEYLPTGLETALKRKVYEALPNMLTDSLEAETWVELHAVLPFDAGGWWLREFIVRDIDGHAIFIGNLPESFKPIGSTGAIKDIAFELVFDILSPDSVTLKVDPSKVLATRKFVEDHVAQELAKLDHKQSVQYATKGNIALNGLGVQGGGDWAVALPGGARVLVKDQAAGKDNGLYVAAAGAWARAADADISAEVTPGLVVAVEQGATLADTRWQLVTDGAIVLGTTALTFQDVTSGYASLASPEFTGAPTAPTQPLDDDSKRLANTEYVRNQIASGAQDFAPQVFRKNLLINGNFDIWQRATENPDAAVGGYVTADRFRTDWNGTALVNISRQAFALGQTAVPNEPSYFLRWQQGTAGAGSTVHTIQQKIESVRTGAGKMVTLSFWAKADSARNITAELQQVFGTGGAPSATVKTPAQVFALGVAWQKCVATFALPSIAGKTLGSNRNDCLAVVLNLPLNVLQTIDIAQMQLEESAVATPFESRPPAVELALCQRYYEAGYAAWCVNALATTSSGSTFGYFAVMVPFKVTKRAVPTITKTDTVANPYVLNFQATPQVDHLFLNNGASYQSTGSYIGSNAFSVNWTASAEL